MKVKELIERLSKEDLEAEVLVEEFDGEESEDNYNVLEEFCSARFAEITVKRYGREYQDIAIWDLEDERAPADSKPCIVMQRPVIVA